MSTARLGDIERRLANIVKPGTIKATDYANARVQVALGRNVTTWIPWVTPRAGNDKTWHAPEVGEQVLVIAPSGDLAQAFVMPGGIFQNNFPAPLNSADQSGTTYSDGAVVQYDRAAHSYQVTVPNNGTATIKVGSNSTVVIENNDIKLNFGTSGGAVTIDSSGVKLQMGSVSLVISSSGISVAGNISQTGSTTTTGSVTAAGDVTAGTVTLKTHTHLVPAVAAGTTTVTTAVGGG